MCEHFLWRDWFAVDVLLGVAVRCYVCNTGKGYQEDDCRSSTLDENLLKDCDVEGVNDGKNYTMCRTFIQEGKSVKYS